MVEYHKSSAPLPYLPNFHGGRKISNNWGQLIGVRSTLISNQKGQRLIGANNKWGQININLLGAYIPVNHRKLMLI